jgi:hypothetical protein
MNLANKTFKNNITGESVKVIDAFENIAILENKQKIDARALLDPNQYTEEIDPNSFFNNQNAYNILAEKIKTLPLSDSMMDEPINNQFENNAIPSISESAVVMTTKEDEMAELARKYGVKEASIDAVTKQQQAFSKYLEEDEIPSSPVQRVEVNNVQQVETGKEYIQPPVQRVQVEDPITQMFKNVKRIVDFKMNLEISNKIPRLDFIEMMEDSYEVSIIDFLAEEFINNILSDPNKLKESIKAKIKQQVYGSLQTQKSIIEKVDELKDDLTVEVITKKEVKRDTKNLYLPKAPRDRKLKEGQLPENQ